MAAKKQHIVVQEMRALLPYFLAINAVYFTLLTVLFLAADLDYTLLTGGIYGNAIAVLNFWLLGITAEKALKKSAKAAQTYMNVMYCVRYLGLFAAMSLAALVPWFNLFAAILPLLFPRLCITLRAFREKT